MRGKARGGVMRKIEIIVGSFIGALIFQTITYFLGVK
jgi:hypothetical protein